VVVTQAMQLVQHKRELANRRPDIAPLLALELIAPADDRRICTEGNHIFGEQRVSTNKVHASHAGLHLSQERSRERTNEQRLDGY
jgi:hypothetical protein